jgi:hypothetical protein
MIRLELLALPDRVLLLSRSLEVVGFALSAGSSDFGGGRGLRSGGLRCRLQGFGKGFGV